MSNGLRWNGTLDLKHLIENSESKGVMAHVILNSY